MHERRAVGHDLNSRYVGIVCLGVNRYAGMLMLKCGLSTRHRYGAPSAMTTVSGKPLCLSTASAQRGSNEAAP